MILSELLRSARVALSQAGCENASYDAFCMLENVTGLTKTQFFLCKDNELERDKENEFLNQIERRIKREPLQYILGKWEFMGIEYSVGPGVLIPRQETECLAETAIRYIRNREDVVVFDLCAGTGCIGISVANACNNATVFLIEKSEEALFYLNRNIEEKGLINTTAVHGNIYDGFLSFCLPLPDIIISNPPYIPTGELNTLQREVMFEPSEALNGGNDGLDFYRAIYSLWFPYLKNGGLLAVEGGDNQAENITAIFSKDYQNKYYLLDGNKIKRIVVVEK